MFPTHFRLHKTSFSLRQVLAYGGSPTKTSKRHANYIDNPNRNEAKTYTSVNTEERVSFTLSVRGKFFPSAFSRSPFAILFSQIYHFPSLIMQNARAFMDFSMSDN